MNQRKLLSLLLFTALAIAISWLGTFADIDLAFAERMPRVDKIAATDFAQLPAPADGIRVFEQRLAQNPDDAVSLTILGQLHLRQARESGDFASYERAEAIFDQALALLPRYHEAGVGLASVYFAQHRFSEAFTLAETIYEQDSERFDALSIVADAQLALGQYDAAAESYIALQGQVDSPSLLARLAQQADLHGQPDEALALLEEAASETWLIGLSADDMAWYLIRLGDFHFKIGDLAEAETHYAAALSLTPQNHAALAKYGELLAAQGRYAEAIEALRQASSLVPQTEYLALLGDVYQVSGQPDLAEQQYQTVETIAELAVLNGTAYDRQLALFFANHDRQVEQALSLALAELEMRQDVYGYDALAWAYYKNGLLAEAEQVMVQALQLGTRDASLHYHAGMIAAAQGKKEVAQTHLAEALSINPHFDLLQAPIAQTTLEQLKAETP
ncbi:MAG: tetratricopeptide repeat protein [Chloroflexota bacterium]